MPLQLLHIKDKVRTNKIIEETAKEVNVSSNGVNNLVSINISNKRPLQLCCLCIFHHFLPQIINYWKKKQKQKQTMP